MDFHPHRLMGEWGEGVDHNVTAELSLLVGHDDLDVVESLVLLAQPDGIHCFPFLVVVEVSPSLPKRTVRGEVCASAKFIWLSALWGQVYTRGVVFTTLFMLRFCDALCNTIVTF